MVGNDFAVSLNEVMIIYSDSYLRDSDLFSKAIMTYCYAKIKFLGVKVPICIHFWGQNVNS